MVPAAIAGKQLCTPIDDIFDLRTGLECKGTTVNPQLLENDTRLVLFGQAFFNEFNRLLSRFAYLSARNSITNGAMISATRKIPALFAE